MGSVGGGSLLVVWFLWLSSCWTEVWLFLQLLPLKNSDRLVAFARLSLKQEKQKSLQVCSCKRPPLDGTRALFWRLHSLSGKCTGQHPKRMIDRAYDDKWPLLFGYKELHAATFSPVRVIRISKDGQLKTPFSLPTPNTLCAQLFNQCDENQLAWCTRPSTTSPESTGVLRQLLFLDTTLGHVGPSTNCGPWQRPQKSFHI